MIKNIKTWVKRLPKPIKTFLRKAYDKYNSRVILDKNMVNNLRKYFDLTYEETICMLRVGTKLNNIFWNILNPKTEKEIKKFYEVNPFYSFSLAYWHMSRGQRRFRYEIIKTCKGNVLDYGGGIGDLCIALARRGFNVTYAEVYGKTFEFAKWLFKKRKYSNIKILDVGKNQEKIWENMYDTIICIDVIEHIPHPEIILGKMAKHLKNNGGLVITALNSTEVTENHPMHLKIDFDAEKLLNSYGLFKSTKHDWLWVKNPK